MGLARVYNDNKFPHKEKFKSQEIEIPAGGFIEMDRDEALQFQGQFKAPIMTGQGTHDPRGFKMIRIEGGRDTPQHNPLINPVTGQKCESPEQLAEQLKQYDHLRVKSKEDTEELQTKVKDQQETIDKLSQKIDDLVTLMKQQGTGNARKHSAKG